MKITKSMPSHRYHIIDEARGFLDSFFLSKRKSRLGLNQEMFNEDFSNMYTILSKRQDDLFDFQCSDQEIAERLLGNVKTRYRSSFLEEAVCELVQEVAKSLVWFGKAFYFLHDNHEENSTHIGSYDPSNIFQLPGFSVQYLPARVERQIGNEDAQLSRELRILDRTKLLQFRMPDSLRRMLATQTSTLASLDKYADGSTMLKFLPSVTTENPNPRSNFDTRIWRDVNDLALYRATKRSGWNGRKYDSRKRSDFFDCHRRIKFCRNQVLLRDHILQQLNQELTRVGQYYQDGFCIAIKAVDALQSITGLNDLEARLVREEVSFEEVLDYCFQK